MCPEQHIRSTQSLFQARRAAGTPTNLASWLGLGLGLGLGLEFKAHRGEIVTLFICKNISKEGSTAEGA